MMAASPREIMAMPSLNRSRSTCGVMPSPGRYRLMMAVSNLGWRSANCSARHTRHSNAETFRKDTPNRPTQCEYRPCQDCSEESTGMHLLKQLTPDCVVASVCAATALMPGSKYSSSIAHWSFNSVQRNAEGCMCCAGSGSSPLSASCLAVAVAALAAVAIVACCSVQTPLPGWSTHWACCCYRLGTSQLHQLVAAGYPASPGSVAVCLCCGECSCYCNRLPHNDDDDLTCCC